MKRWFLVVSLATMTALSLAACGGGEKAVGTVAVPVAIEAPADIRAEDKAEDTKAEAEVADGKAPEDCKRTAVVYSLHDTDSLNAGANLFTERHPNVKVGVVAAGTDELCNRIATETANPITDVLWSGGVDSLAAFGEYFEPYVCAGDELIETVYEGPDGLRIDESPLPMVISYNKDLIEKDGLTIPETWEDLTKPERKDKIVYCLPSKSGSAYIQLCTMILGHDGKENGRDFTKKLYNNLDGKIVDSSGKCCRMVTDGESYVELTLEKTAVQYRDGPLVGFVYSKDGTSTVPDGVVLVKGCPNEENAKLFTDFVTSKECQTERSENWDCRPARGDVEANEGMTELGNALLADYDFDWAINEKEAIIKHLNGVMVG